VAQGVGKPPRQHGEHPGFNSSDTRFEVKLLEKRPGPLAYKTKQTLEDKLVARLQKGALGNFGSNVARFVASELAPEVPGPGHYPVVPSEGGAKASASFKSSTSRRVFEPTRNPAPPPG
jgi:hypothetical protein